KYTKFLISYYWINSLGHRTSIHRRLVNAVIPSGKENQTATIPYNHTITPLQSTSSTGTYYCDVKWDDIQIMGKGVFVLARDTGYVETSSEWEVLIILTPLFAVLSIIATALLLRKRKANVSFSVSCPQQVLCPRSDQVNILRKKVQPQPPSASPPPPPPLPLSPPPVYD
ncbi:NFAM1 protein, partial [Pedionomus torquatus]|nr:NFAM1 protein [Pedionomus torquatus]